MTPLLNIMRALADPTRMRITLLIRQLELSVSEVVQILGQSQPRVSRHIKILAEAGIAFDSLPDLPNDKVIATLVAVPGIGQWTAEIYAMFSLGRADVFAPGDLALQEAAKLVFGLNARPSERQLRAMAEAWSPWRAVAARLLWAYYRVAKSREGIK